MTPKRPSKTSWGVEPTSTLLATSSGRLVDPEALQVSDLCIEDIAHSLSLQCRFGGHTSEFYSVAQHCVEVSNRVPPKHALWGLLHDASEAYLIDLPRPVKRLFPKYKTYEQNVLRLVAKRFGLKVNIPKAVKEVDEQMVVWEASKLLKVPMKSKLNPLKEPLVPQSPWQAERSFLKRFEELTSGS